MLDQARTCPTCAGYPDPLYRRFVNGINLGHDAKAHRIVNFLWWGGVRDVGHFFEMDEYDLREINGIADAGVRLILERREFPGSARSPIGTLRRAADLAESMAEPWARALAGAFKSAAENHAYCRRVNAKRPGEVPELPDPTAEELANVARLLVEHATGKRGS